MERLTRQFQDGGFYCEAIDDVGIKGVNYPTYIGKAVDKLAEYEDLEEKGLLLRLPCKLGSAVYAIEIEDIEHFSYKLVIKEYEFTLEMLDLIGKCIFLTKEEAEKVSQNRLTIR